MPGETFRVAVAAVFQETNTFSPVPTEREDFERRWYIGDRLVESFQGTRTVIGGFLDGAASAGFRVIPVFGTFAIPSGTVTATTFSAICEELKRQLARCEPVDGILLELHGDLVADGWDDAEERIVEIVRDRFPTTPIASVLDFHASMALPRLSSVDILIGYRTNPHVDTYEQGVVATELLERVLTGALRPYRAHRGLAVVAAPIVQGTEAHPMRTLFAEADRLQKQSGLANVTVHAGYAYADRAYTGMGFEATGDLSQRDQAELAVEKLLNLADELRGDFHADFPSAADAMANAILGPAPVAVADTGDNINGGGPGDTTWLICEALANPNTSFLGTVADARSLKKICAAGEGAVVDLNLGGTASVRSGEPVAVTAEILRITDGTFTNTGPMATGATVSMGGAAWIRFANCDLVVQQTPVQPNDTSLFEAMGIDVAGYDVLLLKGAAALRAAWLPVVSRIVEAGTPGETDSLVRRLTYKRARLLPG